MAVQVQVIGVDEVREMLDIMPEVLFDNTKKAFSKNVLTIQRNITKPMKTGVNGLQSRTGNLAKSIKPKVYGKNLKDLGASVTTDSVYAPIHEKGGDIIAKNAYLNLQGGPFLNIPAKANMTAAGIMRESAMVVFNTGGYIIKINAPKARYAVLKAGKVMFWLVKQVTIKPTLKMIKSAEDEVPTLLSSLNTVIFEGLE